MHGLPSYGHIQGRLWVWVGRSGRGRRRLCSGGLGVAQKRSPALGQQGNQVQGLRGRFRFQRHLWDAAWHRCNA